MAMRPGDADKEFKKKLQNPPNPVNDTEPSPEMKEHLDKINDGTLIREEKEKREETARKQAEEDKKYTLYCNKCRRPNLKRNPHGGYSCGFCGLSSISPLRMALPPKKEE